MSSPFGGGGDGGGAQRRQQTRKATTTLASIQEHAVPRTPRFSIARDGAHDKSTNGI